MNSSESKPESVTSQKKNIVVLISGSGSNLQAFIEAQKNSGFNGSIKAVISNKEDVYGLERAKQANIPAICIPHKEYSTRERFDLALANAINQYSPDLIILAGFMRILTPDFVKNYKGKLLNIHPSLLPKYPGLHTHRKAIENGDKLHGTTVHFVTEELDGGPLVGQGSTVIQANDSEESLNKRIQTLEHKLYPYIAKLFLSGAISLNEDVVYFENKQLEQVISI
ncbi:MAG: phosphoribosylglycinamide formyltransferase [Kangiellaceae bacterium]|nr:phosphoribosylglycinamide formyltransferase [Kangiellaceae bacterium]